MGASSSSTTVVPTVNPFDLSAYLGLWHEVAHYPFFWENGCASVTARYIQAKGHIRVLNSCGDETMEGRAHTGHKPSALLVSFFAGFEEQYNVIWVQRGGSGGKYKRAIVTGAYQEGDKDFQHVWLLQRDKPTRADRNFFRKKIRELKAGKHRYPIHVTKLDWMPIS